MNDQKTPIETESQTASKNAIDDHLLIYRSHLVIANQKAQEDYDKAILSLAGGAFAVSLLFIEKITTGQISHAWLLLTAWLCWLFSIAAVLISYFSSQKALQKAIDQCDSPSPA